MKRVLILALICLYTTAGQASEGSRTVIMFGPMMHVNFGKGKTRVSWALEVSYWNYKKWPWSVNAAIEAEKGKIRLYSEAQTGVGVAGLSAGPLLEFNRTESKLVGGFQTSVWANYFIGIDIRARFAGGETYFCPGTYLKLPGTLFTADAWDSSDRDSGDYDDD